MLTIDEEAVKLATAHYCAEPTVSRVFRINGVGEKSENGCDLFGLLEVNEFTIASGIMPFESGPDPRDGYFRSSIIVEVTPEEFDQIQSGELPLPFDWSIGEEIPKPYER